MLPKMCNSGPESAPITNKKYIKDNYSTISLKVKSFSSIFVVVETPVILHFYEFQILLQFRIKANTFLGENHHDFIQCMVIMFFVELLGVLSY